MSLIPPKRLFNIKTMETVMYKDVENIIKDKGYVAISHVWGDQTLYDPEELEIKGGVSWKVPMSDPKKMYRIKKAMKYFKKKYCWLDVVCMPQDKQDEINLEIPFMGDYYAGACMTLVIATSDHTFWKIATKTLNMFSNIVGKVGTSTVLGRYYAMARATELGIDYEKWCTRAWTFQEAVLSKNIKYVGYDESYTDLSKTLEAYAWAYTFGQAVEDDEETSYIVELGHATRDYCKKGSSLAGMAQSSCLRQCFKQHDRLYGLLGILGYTTFPVTYDISLDDLNDRIIRYAFARGDISWLSSGGSRRTGLIQPMYEDFRHIGDIWKEETPGICGMELGDNTMKMNACTIGTVTACVLSQTTP